LIHGGTHKASAVLYEDAFYLDPGSATGAFTASDPNPVPSFILLNIQGTTAVAYIYTLGEDGAISVNKEKFTKDDE
jgi:predicted phosphodiesterase